jgi:hypothetical protein
MDSRISEIVRNKPELITAFPRWMLSEALENELKETEGLAIVEIAGRDSIAAALEAASKRDFKAFLPTIAYTGTEFGDWETPFKKTDVLKEERRTLRTRSEGFRSPCLRCTSPVVAVVWKVRNPSL